MEGRTRQWASRSKRQSLRHAHRGSEEEIGRAGIADAEGKTMRRREWETRGQGDITRMSNAIIDARRVPASSCLLVLLLLLTVHCSLLTAFAQPGMPQPSSPLYGAQPVPGQTSTGLPRALKNVGIDQR